MALLSNPDFAARLRARMADVEGQLYNISVRLAGDYENLVPSDEALEQQNGAHLKLKSLCCRLRHEVSIELGHR